MSFLHISAIKTVLSYGKLPGRLAAPPVPASLDLAGDPETEIGRFPEMKVPHFIILSNRISHYKPSIWGYPHLLYGNPHLKDHQFRALGYFVRKFIQT